MLRKIKKAIDTSTNEELLFVGSADATYMSNGHTVEEVLTNLENAQGNHCNIIEVSSVPSILLPNTYYKVTNAVSSVDIVFGEPVPDIVNEYTIEFIAGNDTGVILPSNVVWSCGNTCDFVSGNTYVISIINNIATCVSWNTLV